MKKYFNIKKITMFMVAIIGFFMINTMVKADSDINVTSNSGDGYHGVSSSLSTEERCYYQKGTKKVSTTRFSDGECPAFIINRYVSLSSIEMPISDNSFSGESYGKNCSEIETKISNNTLKNEAPEIYDVSNGNYYEKATELDMDVEITNVMCLKKLGFDDNEELSDCATVGVVSKYIKLIFNIIRFLIPTVIIIYSVIDFAGVVVSGEQDSMQKAKKHFIQRILIGILILLVPTILNIILKLAGIIDKDIMEYFCTTI